jgi:hypothetical protein
MLRYASAIGMQSLDDEINGCSAYESKIAIDARSAARFGLSPVEERYW